jgi:hypothetical protein
MGVDAEHALMQKLIHTYGKTWHTWHTNLDKQLPLGVPQLMMGFTTDGQADPAMVQTRDRRFGADTEQEKRNRADIAAPSIDAGANGWEHGKTFQISDPTGIQHELEQNAAHGARDTGPTQNSRSSKQ